MPELTCREFIDFLDDYVENRQKDNVRDTFERHMEACPDCVDYLKTYRETILLARSACAADPSLPTPADAPEELIQAILNSRPRTS